MPKAIVVENQLNHIIKAGAKHPVARCCACLYPLCIGLIPTETAKLQVDDFQERDGTAIAEARLRFEAAFNNRPLPLMRVSPRS